MVAKLKTVTCSVFVAALIAGAGAAWAASPVAGFGPEVMGDASLQASVDALGRTIAWQNTPDGDIYTLALSTTAPEMKFENVAAETGSVDIVAAGPDIFNGPSLNASMRALHEIVAWRASPEGDAYAFALRQLETQADFERVALASVPAGGFEPNE